MVEEADSGLKGVTINFDQLKQLSAFETGELRLKPRYETKQGFLWGKVQNQMGFNGLTSILPFKLPPKCQTVHPQFYGLHRLRRTIEEEDTDMSLVGYKPKKPLD
jgi:hypothetical protein